MPFDLKDVKQLVDLMRRSDLTEFELEQEGIKVRIKRDSTGAPIVTATQPPFPMAMPSAYPAPAAAAPAPVAMPAPAPAAAPAAPVAEVGIVFVKSPMVGTFYRAASPESPSFVDKGSEIKEDTIVCIIEAMKVMNEIQAEVKGTIVEVLAENGTSVEYGQPLFKVKVG
jgi:acetyl-CoA carboxylase biotin carboxyl carrier protein